MILLEEIQLAYGTTPFLFVVVFDDDKNGDLTYLILLETLIIKCMKMVPHKRVQ